MNENEIQNSCILSWILKAESRHGSINYVYLSIHFKCCSYFVLSCNTRYNIKSSEKSSLIDSEEIKGQRSISECVMRCQRKTKEGFFTNNNECFCHNGVVENQGDINGISMKKIRLSPRKEGLALFFTLNLINYFERVFLQMSNRMTKKMWDPKCRF